MKKPALLFLILILQAYTLRAQSPEFREYLFQAIQTSPSAKHIDLLRLRSKHQYSYRLSELKTSIRLTGDLPGISRSITSVWQPDGGQRFLQQNRAYSSLGLSDRKPLVFSGGTLSLSSGLTRLDIFEPSDHTEWQSSPLVLSLSQPLFGYNDLKQARVNAANQLSIADLEYVFESFSFKRKIANLVLQYYLVAKQLELTESRLARMDTTLLLAKERLRLGKTPRSDIDALTINKLKLEEEYERHKANLDDLILKFREHEISPFVIDDLNSWNIPSYDLAEIQSTAVKRNPTFRKNAVRLFEANEQITKNKRDAGPGATINVAFGYNQRADRFDDVYNNVLGSQRMSIGVSVPLYDGGASRYQQLIDNHRLKGIEQTAFADSLALMQKIRSEHMAYELLLKNRTSSLTILELTKNRLNDYSEMHGLGKISVDQYLLAENEYAQRELEYYSVMVNLWRKVFTIRALCVTE